MDSFLDFSTQTLHVFLVPGLELCVDTKTLAYLILTECLNARAISPILQAT